MLSMVCWNNLPSVSRPNTSPPALPRRKKSTGACRMAHTIHMIRIQFIIYASHHIHTVQAAYILTYHTGPYSYHIKSDHITWTISYHHIFDHFISSSWYHQNHNHVIHMNHVITESCSIYIIHISSYRTISYYINFIYHFIL